MLQNFITKAKVNHVNKVKCGIIKSGSAQKAHIYWCVPTVDQQVYVVKYTEDFVTLGDLFAHQEEGKVPAIRIEVMQIYPEIPDCIREGGRPPGIEKVNANTEIVVTFSFHETHSAFRKTLMAYLGNLLF